MGCQQTIIWLAVRLDQLAVRYAASAADGVGEIFASAGETWDAICGDPEEPRMVGPSIGVNVVSREEGGGARSRRRVGGDLSLATNNLLSWTGWSF